MSTLMMKEVIGKTRFEMLFENGLFATPEEFMNYTGAKENKNDIIKKAEDVILVLDIKGAKKED